MLLDKQMSIFPVWQMATYPIWQMQILPNCLYVVAHGSSKTTVCVEGMHKSCAALSLHTGVLSKTFAIKSCTNPARHIFPWLPGEAVGLHTGVLTKTFAMSVLYLKSELNCGLGAINGEEGGRPWKSKGSLPSEPAQRIARTLPGEPAHWRTACTPLGQLRTGLRSHASRSVKVKQLSARHLL